MQITLAMSFVSLSLLMVRSFTYPDILLIQIVPFLRVFSGSRCRDSGTLFLHTQLSCNVHGLEGGALPKVRGPWAGIYRYSCFKSIPFFFLTQIVQNK